MSGGGGRKANESMMDLLEGLLRWDPKQRMTVS